MSSATTDTRKDESPREADNKSVRKFGFLSALKVTRKGGRWALAILLRAFAELTAVSLGLGIIWLCLLTSVMAKGEMDVSFLKRNFALWFTQAYDGQDADIETFKVQWHPERGAIGFLAEDIVVKDADDASLLTVDSIYTETPVSALLNRGFEAKRLNLEGGQFTLRRDENGAMFGAVGGPDAFGRLGPIIPIAGSQGEVDLIDAVSLQDTDVFFRDDVTGLSLDLQQVGFQTSISDVEILAQGEAVLVSPTTDKDKDNSSSILQTLPTLKLSVKRERAGDQALDVSIEIDRFNPADLMFDNEAFNALKQLDAPFNFTSEWRDVGTENPYASFSAEVADQRAEWALPAFGVMKDFSAKGLWKRALNDVNISNVMIESEHINFSGGINVSNLTPQSKRQQRPIGIDINLEAFDWDALGVLSRALSINNGAIKGQYFVSADQLEIEKIDLPIADYRLIASAQLGNISGRADKVPLSVKATGQFDGLLNEVDLLSIWPKNFILGGRNWVQSSIVAATLSDMKFNFDISDVSKLQGNLPDEAFKLDFKVDDGIVQYIRTMTPMDEARGYGQVRGNSFDFTVTGGRVGNLIVDSGRVEIPQLFPQGGDLNIALEGNGPVDYMVTLIDQKPFEYARIYNLAPEDFSGQGRVKFKVNRPLGRLLDQNLIRYEVEVNGTNVTAPFGFGSYTMSDGELFLRADKDGMTIKGPANLGPLEVDINWRENFDYGATPTTLSLFSHIDHATLDKLGLSLREYFGGDIPFTLDAIGEGVTFDSGKITAQLRNSELVVGDYWAKAKGVEGDLGLSITRDATGHITVDDLSASAPGLNITGNIKLDEDLRLLEASVNSIRIDDVIDARLNVKRTSLDHPLQMILSGDYLNLDGLVKTAIWQQDGRPQFPLTLTANMNTLQLAPTYQISKASLLYNHTGQAIDQFRFSGGSEDGPVILDLQTLDDGPYSNRLTFDIANASEATGAFFELDNIQGGRLFGEAVRPRNGDNFLWSGTVNVDDFILVKSPFLAQILSLASLNGLANVLSGGGLKFETVELPFTWGEGVLGLEEARAAGPALGLTADGTIDISNKTLDLDGTLIPAYAANSLIGSIPIIGDIFGGSADDATLGLTYGISGTFDQAQVNVNPLSALTPGILRTIFKPEREKKRVDIPSDTQKQDENIASGG